MPGSIRYIILSWRLIRWFCRWVGTWAGLTAFLKVTYDLRKARRELESVKKKENSRIITEPASSEEIQALFRKERHLKSTRGLFLVVTASLAISLVSATLAVPIVSRALNDLEASRASVDVLRSQLAVVQEQLSGAQSQVVIVQGQLRDCQAQAEVAPPQSEGSSKGSENGSNVEGAAVRSSVPSSTVGSAAQAEWKFRYIFEPWELLPHESKRWRMAGSLVCDAMAKVFEGLSAHERGDVSELNADLEHALSLLSDAEDAYSRMVSPLTDRTDIQNMRRPSLVSDMMEHLRSLGIQMPDSHHTLAKWAGWEVGGLRKVLSEKNFVEADAALRLQEALARIYYVATALSFIMEYSSE